MWAWWNIQNSRTKKKTTHPSFNKNPSCHGVTSCAAGENSQRKAPALTVAEKREFSGALIPLELELWSLGRK